MDGPEKKNKKKKVGKKTGASISGIVNLIGTNSYIQTDKSSGPLRDDLFYAF